MNLKRSRAIIARAMIVGGVLSLVGCGGGGGGGSGAAGSTLSLSGAAIDEGDTGVASLAFAVTLSAPQAAVVTVDYATAAGTATAGVDYDTTTGTLTFPAGSTSQTILVPVRGDLLDENDETFSVSLANVSGEATLGTASATGTILDDDPLPALSISDVAQAEGDTGTTTFTFNVALSAISGRTVSVNYATTAGSAAAGSDFAATSGTLTFNPGQVSRQFSVTITGDTTVEPDETFTVSLSAPVNATLADATATGTITNDDVSTGGPFGLDARPANPTCLAPARPDDDATATTVAAFATAPAFVQPTKLLQAPGDASRWFVLEKTGRIRVFPVSNPAAVTTWLDFSALVNSNFEGGMLGMAFHPDYPTTREVFVSYTGNPGGPMVSRVSRVILDNVTSPSVTTEQILLSVDQPFDNHNGGDIAFGNDGYLYFGLGDGGSGNDPFDYAQNNTRLLGKMLRIAVVGVPYPSPGYTIPADNPFAANARCGPAANAAACPEIYATGFRNPWRWSFDQPTGVLWLGDVGQGSREEINRIERGGNYGWDCREGFIGGPSTCSTPGLIDPVTDYPRSDGTSVTGGFVYRGSAMPNLVGRYVFGDYGSGRIWALRDDGQGGYSNDLLVDTSLSISAFGLGEDGELYIADFAGGLIWRLAPSSGSGADPIPSSLAATGCVDASDPTVPASGMIPYTINAAFWSDGAVKERYFAIPDGTTVAHDSAGDFEFPPGSVILKSFRLGGQLIETRLFMRHPDGVWAGYTYEWNSAQTAATRVIGGKARQVGGQTWIYPSEGECMRCHTSVAGFSLGPEIAQLNRLYAYPLPGRTANQLATLEHIDWFTTPLPGAPETLPALADPRDAGRTLLNRARAYLHTNCAQCHRPGGPTPSTMDLRATTALPAMNVCDVLPQSGDLGILNARLIAAGDATRSVLVARMNRRDANGMPPIGSNLIDSSGVMLLSNWINSLTGCQ